MSNFYRVTIATSSGAAPRDGFIDNKTIERYMAEGSTPTTLVQTTAKERANVRFMFLREQLSYDANVFIRDIVASGGSATAAPTSFVFTAVVERGDAVLNTRDESNGGAMLTGTAALTRWVARALIEARTMNRDIFDPTTSTAPGNSTQSARGGVQITPLTTGAASLSLTAAEALITVSKLV